MKKFTFALALLGVGISGAALYAWTTNALTEPTVQTDARPAVLIQIQQAAELTTAVYQGDVTVPVYLENKVLGIPTGVSKLLYVGRGEVRAGVDLSQVVLEGNEIRLPAPRILDKKIDVTQSGTQMFNPAWFSGSEVANKLQDEAQRQAQKRIVESACKSDLLAQANQKAQQVVEGIVQSKEVKIQVQTTKPTDCK